MMTRALQPSVTVSTNPTYIRLDLLSGNQAFCHKRAYSLTTILQQLCLRAIFERSTSNQQTTNERSTSNLQAINEQSWSDTRYKQPPCKMSWKKKSLQQLNNYLESLLRRYQTSKEKMILLKNLQKEMKEEHADPLEVCSAEEHDQTLPRTNTNQERRDQDEERIGAERWWS